MTFAKVCSLIHNGKHWNVVCINGSYFARCGTSDTGPYSTAIEAVDFITMIRP